MLSQEQKTMPTRPLGDSDLHITPIGYGAWAIGGGNWEFGWGHQEDQDSIGLPLRAAAAHGRSPGEVAIAWTLRHPAVTGAIVGGRNAKQVEGIVGAAQFRLSEDELRQIENFLRENP